MPVLRGDKPKFVFNPKTGRTFPVGRNGITKDRPDLIACDTAAGPKSYTVRRGDTQDSPVTMTSTPPPAAQQKVKGPEDFVEMVNSSEDKEQLISYGSQLGVKLTKNMNVDTMRTRILAAASPADDGLAVE